MSALATACGGGSTRPDAAEPQPADPATTCDPSGKVPCVAGIAEPCAGIDTGYDGDEYCRAAPDPSTGFQIHVGPKDYSDPDEVAKYLAAPGDETNWAETVATPNDTTVYWDGYYSYMRPGSHHFILYGMPPGSAPPASDGPVTNGSGAESAQGAIGGTFLAGATVPVQDAMPHDPDSQGAATEVAPHSVYSVNLHFINTSDHPLSQEIWVNFHEIAESDIRHWKRAITWYGGLGMNIPPATEYKLDSTGSPCTPPQGASNIHVLGVTGHVHANTVEYSATMVRGGESTLLFQDFDWHEPREFRFNSVDDNGTPDAARGIAGGYSGVLALDPADQFTWECSGYNKSNVRLTFSNKVYDGEMCNVFGFYETDTKDAQPWTCAFF
ncbi:MAG TPA: hypothetical protein VHE30_28490 [Polyangiaceae bacterium]|nr:hypothetical protein [Polyangiaceae bacterium]